MCTSREYRAALLRDSGFRDVGTPHLVDPLLLTRTAERVRYLRESASELHQTLAGPSPTERDESWQEINTELSGFEGADGLGPCELVVASGTKTTGDTTGPRPHRVHTHADIAAAITALARPPGAPTRGSTSAGPACVDRRVRGVAVARARRGRIAAVLAAAALTVGCAAPPAAPATDVPASSADAPAPRPPCARPADEVRQVELDPAIHLRVTILLAGTGNRGVALLPQAGADVCQLADFGHHLADNGYRMATFGPWSSPNERPATAAYDALIAAGAGRAVVLGASQGATVALANAAALSPAPAGVITLSADGDAVVGAAAYPGPLLLAGTENDMYSPGGVTRRLADLHPGTEEVLLFAGADHGIELLDRTTEPIEKFLRRTMPT